MFAGHAHGEGCSLVAGPPAGWHGNMWRSVRRNSRSNPPSRRSTAKERNRLPRSWTPTSEPCSRDAQPGGLQGCMAKGSTALWRAQGRRPDCGSGAYRGAVPSRVGSSPPREGEPQALLKGKTLASVFDDPDQPRCGRVDEPRRFTRRMLRHVRGCPETA